MMSRKEKAIEAIHEAAGDFCGWDWTMQFGPYYVESAEQLRDLYKKNEDPEEKESLRKAFAEARAYEKKVLEDAEEAERLGTEAIEAIERDDMYGALNLIVEARGHEDKYGDSPSYSKAAEAVTYWIDDAERMV